MTFAVLQTWQDNIEARQKLVRRGLSSLKPDVIQKLIRLTGIGGPLVGELNKSWDLLRTVEFLEEHVQKDQPVLDLGAYCSEIIEVLDKLEYRELHGVDLNSKIEQWRLRHHVKFRICDFRDTPFDDGTFAAITAISALEHDYQPDRLLAEVSRLLEPGGFFIASTDYWPDKINTDDTQFFGMSWRIFSADELRAFFDQAAGYGLIPYGDCSYDAKDAMIKCAGRDYTFAWFVLQKLG